ncbi:hypothetical protein CWRG_01756 [Chthonomonas calidirosea]|uniref:Uncharacterized protein n=1 Tax=Chthonomonas calidirosea (strain DSM 23976 / ICMP 18418 / T49) TaxID=1303518 RepID=S0EWF7_CHTCT|nr:hypothetical protein CCALI_02321 [Chthonomonas calidirosea T49]CEK17203.1 hypothetical protein CWRG_01756 [Chthonomonas calidirosea]CEK18261.1 hypothetical protein CTKA_01775 [Chthonomonas calidirosea]
MISRRIRTLTTASSTNPVTDYLKTFVPLRETPILTGLKRLLRPLRTPHQPYKTR